MTNPQLKEIYLLTTALKFLSNFFSDSNKPFLIVILSYYLLIMTIMLPLVTLCCIVSFYYKNYCECPHQILKSFTHEIILTHYVSIYKLSVKQKPPKMLLSGYEAYMPSRANHQIYTNFGIAAQYNTQLDLNIVTKALKVLCLKFPHFSLTVGDEKLYTSEYINEYDLVNCIDVIPNSTPQKIFAKYTQLKFSYSNKTPLWKVVLNSDSNILFIFMDHTYFDGTAGKNFHVEFSKALDIKPSNDDSTIINTQGLFSYNYPNATKMMNFKPRNVKPKPMGDIARPTIDLELMKKPMWDHNTTLIHLSKEQTNKLVNFSRNNGFKLTSLLNSIGSKAVVSVYPESGNLKSEMKFRSLTAINTRYKVESTSFNDIITTFGLFISRLTNDTDFQSIEDGEIIQMSKNFQKYLSENKEAASEDSEFFETKALKDRSIIDKTLDNLKAINDKPNFSLVISNLGMISNEKIKTVYFDQPMVDALFAIHLISSANSGVTFNLTSHRAIPKEVYNNYVTNFQTLINSFCNLYM